MEKAKTSHSRKLIFAIFTALFIGHQYLVKAEESSILQSATIDPATLQSLSIPVPDGYQILEGSFKNQIRAKSPNSNPMSIQVDLNLPKAKIVQAVFILAMSPSSNHPNFIGGSQIYLVNGVIETLAKVDVFDSGIYQLDPPGQATSIIIRRVSDGDDRPFGLSFIRAYQCTNLMQYGVNIHYSTPSLSGFEAQNLVNYLENRSSTQFWNARTAASYQCPKATYKSCYVTNQTNIAADGNQMKIVFDLLDNHFIHAVLFVDNLNRLSAWTFLSEDDKKSYLQNLQIYIGNDPENATNNNLCPGGPFLQIDDPSNYSDDYSNQNTENAKPWNYGQETWCNLEGRYVHLISNLGHLEGETFTQSICSISIFGTIYKRSGDLVKEVQVLAGQTSAKIAIPHIYADSTRPIGNILAINVRQTSDLSVQITRTISESILTVDTSELVAGNTYDLVIESFDNDSIPKSTLKIDTIKIMVLVLQESGFENELQSQVIRLGEPYSWTLPEIIEGSYPLETIDFEIDFRIVNNLSLDPDSRTFTFSGEKVANDENLIGKYFRLEIKLVDTNQNISYFIQTLEIAHVESDVTEEETLEKDQSDVEIQASQAQLNDNETESSPLELQPSQKEQREEDDEQVQDETIFKISQALINHYSSELTFQDLSKRLDNQKSELKSQIENGIRPLELRVEEASNVGRVEVTFTKKIKFDENFAQLIRDSQGKDNPIIQIIMIEPGQIVSNNLESWSIDHVSDQKVVLKIKFARPLVVSQDDEADKLFLHFSMSQWATENGESLPEFVVKIRELPRQVVSETEAEKVLNAGKMSSSSSVLISTLYIAGMILIQSSLYHLWSAMNSQQVVIQMSLMKNVKFPANAMLFQSFLINIASLDIFPTEWLEELIYYLPEQTAYNINFEALGIESNLFIMNTGSGIWIISIFIIYAIINLLFYGWKRVWNRFGQPIFFNGMIRTFMEMFQDLLLLAVLNLRTAEWDTPYDAVNFSNVLSIIIVIIQGAILLFLIVWLYINKNRMNDKKFKERSGALVESTNTLTHKWSIIAVFLMFFMRKIAFVSSAIFLQNFVWAQIAIQTFTSLGMIMMIQRHQPFGSKFANNIEVFNECSNLWLCYFAICFTDFILDPELKSDLGYPYMGSNSSMLFVHLSVLVINFIKAIILKCKTYSQKRKQVDRANKIKNGTSTKLTQEQVTNTSQPKTKARIKISTITKTDHAIIDEVDENDKTKTLIKISTIPKTDLTIIDEVDENEDCEDILERQVSGKKELCIEEEVNEDIMVNRNLISIPNDNDLIREVDAFILDEDQRLQDAAKDYRTQGVQLQDNYFSGVYGIQEQPTHSSKKENSCQGKIRDSRLIYNEDD